MIRPNIFGICFVVIVGVVILIIVVIVVVIVVLIILMIIIIILIQPEVSIPHYSESRGRPVGWCLTSNIFVVPSHSAMSLQNLLSC